MGVADGRASFNTGQGCQFTSEEWTGRLEGLGVKASMDGKCRWMDNAFIGRLRRGVKYERIYRHGNGTPTDSRRELTWWLGLYYDWHPHEDLDNLSMTIHISRRTPAS